MSLEGRIIVNKLMSLTFIFLLLFFLLLIFVGIISPIDLSTARPYVLVFIFTHRWPECIL